jgi:hypothetical protein
MTYQSIRREVFRFAVLEKHSSVTAEIGHRISQSGVGQRPRA